MNKKNTNHEIAFYHEEIIKVNKNTISCDGGADFGHPIVYLNLDKKGEIVCPYCSKRYIFKKFKHF